MSINLKENFDSLSAAVIGQSCEDYVMDIKYMSRYKNVDKDKYNYYKKDKKDIEDFFYNEMNGIYSNSYIDPDALITRLKEIAKEKKNNKTVRFLKNNTKYKT